MNGQVIVSMVPAGCSAEAVPAAPAARGDSGVEEDHQRLDEGGVPPAEGEAVPAPDRHGENPPHSSDSHGHR